MTNTHIPVLLYEVIESFSIFKKRSDLVYYDGTFGRGGHAKAICEAYSIKQILATDQDQLAISFALENFPHIQISNSNFSDFAIQNQNQRLNIDMILLDLGVSSPQLDQAERGFSFNKDGPLDMRMNQKLKMTAGQIVNTISEDELMKLFSNYGEVENPYKVVKAIIKDRSVKEFTSTLQLAGLIERVDGWRKKGFHPATQYFMALRLAVNSELEVVEKAIPLLINMMNDGGRISIITFHSLEDRIVKNIFKDCELGFVINKKVIVPSEEECKINPRARSAKLRIFQKGKEPLKIDKFAARRALMQK